MNDNNQQSKKKSLILVLSLIAVSIALILPIPYYIEAPGSAEPVGPMITVDGRQDEYDGNFMLTTVSIRPTTVGSAIIAKIKPYQELISKKELMGGNSNKVYSQVQSYYMASSENTAKQVALELAELPYEFKYKGIYVMEVMEKSSFYGKLEVGDLIYRIDDHEFTHSKEFIDYVKKKKSGTKVTVYYIRDNKKYETSGTLMVMDKSKAVGLGIVIVDENELTTPSQIDIDAGKIGGPSAGLMFTLETYSLLSQKDLRKGREIAGTGTINSDGSVGMIGGIDKKVVAASNEGAEIFFAPAEKYTKKELKADPTLKDNYEVAVKTAKEIKTKMKIIPVNHVQEAITYLETGKTLKN